MQTKKRAKNIWDWLKIIGKHTNGVKMKQYIDIFKKIVGKKDPKQELNYLFYDKDGFLVGTDTRRMLIFEGLPKIEKNCIIDINDARFLIGNDFNFTNITLNYPSCEDSKYPDWRRILPKDDAKEVKINDENPNFVICKIAREGFDINTNYIQDLFKPKIDTVVYKMRYKNKNEIFEISGKIDCWDFKFLTMSIIKVV